MKFQKLVAFVSLMIVAVAGWYGGAGDSDKKSGERPWIEVTPGVWRTATLPAGYAIIDGETGLLIDAPQASVDWKSLGVKKIETVLLTQHHRDTCAAADRFLAANISVRAAKAAAEWLTPVNVEKYWKDSLPLRTSRASYLVLPVGLDGVDGTLEDKQTISWHGWSIQVVAAHGASRGQVAFAARKGGEGPLLLFCGDALAAPGKLWAPYTTDWDHWTDAGLTPTAQTLRKLADLKPAMLLPSHGEPVRSGAVDALNQTAAAVEEMAFLKSFERFTKIRLGNAPSYRFRAKDQVASNGSKPWTQVSEHIFLTGNTYVLISKENNAFLVMDPWDPNSAKQLPRLREDRKLGPLEVVMFSHAHFDHYDGIYSIPEREKFQVWTLDRVAAPLAEPFFWRAPFLDPRPVTFDRRFKDGETASWREYRFRFHHFPGQSEFTMGVETTIDGKRCFFTADNFFHQDQFSGSGGWMGLNRSYPLPYAASAQKILDAAPDWVMAEHGGPFEFNAEDFRRRVRWGQVSATAADALCVSGQHRHDWDPHRVHVEPLVQKAQTGDLLKATLVAANPLRRTQKLTVTLPGRGYFADQIHTVEIKPGGTCQQEIRMQLAARMSPGRHVFPLHVSEGKMPDGADAFLVVDIVP